MMKLLLYSCEFPVPKNPSASIFTWYIASELKHICESVHVVAAFPWLPKIGLFKYHTKWANIMAVPDQAQLGSLVVDYPRYPFLPKVCAWIHPLLQALGSYNRVKRLHQQQNFDVINAHSVYPDGVAAAILGQWLNIPVVLTALGSDINLYSNHPIRRKQIIWALQHSAGITTVSSALKKVIEELDKNLNNKITVIPNGVNSSDFITFEKMNDRAVLRKELHLQQQSRYLLFVGRLSEEKGLDVLLNAMALLEHSNSPPCYLVIAGKGAIDKELVELTASLALQHRIRFLGGLAHSDVVRWMSAVDAFCLPSLREGMPNVVLEALAAGLPIVASNVGGIPEIVNKNTGVLVEPRNIKSLAQGIELLFSKEWDKKIIQEHVIKQTWPKAAIEYYEFLKMSIKS